MPSVRLSVRLSVCPSVNFSCPLHNSDTIQDTFMKPSTNVNHQQTMCREGEGGISGGGEGGEWGGGYGNELLRLPSGLSSAPYKEELQR